MAVEPKIAVRVTTMLRTFNCQKGRSSTNRSSKTAGASMIMRPHVGRGILYVVCTYESCVCK